MYGDSIGTELQYWPFPWIVLIVGGVLRGMFSLCTGKIWPEGSGARW
jgi:hypothetical protein